MSFVDKLSKNFGIAKQWTKQKMGKATGSEESKEFQLILDKLHIIKHEMKALLRLVEEQHEMDLKQTAMRIDLQNSMGKVGSHHTAGELSAAQATAFVTIETAITTAKQDLDNQFKSLIVGPLSTFLASDELHAALELKKKYDRAHLLKDNCAHALEDAKASNKADKIDATEKELAAATAEYDQIKGELTASVEAVEKIKDELLQGNFPQYLKAERAFYAAALHAHDDNADAAPPAQEHPETDN